MERCLETFPQLGIPMDTDDGKYVSGLSTILVATIQEAKDRISQIEYIFCSQLFPNIQNRSKRLQKIISEVRRTTEGELRKEEAGLLSQLKKLQLEKEQVLQENHSLQMDRERLLKEREENTSSLTGLEKRVAELEGELHEKSIEVMEGMKLERKLLHFVQETKTNALTDKAQQAKQFDQMKSEHLIDLRCLQTKVDELELVVKEKNEELLKGKDLLENLLKKMGSWELKLIGSESVKKDHEEEEGNRFIATIERVQLIAAKLWEDKVSKLPAEKMQENLLRKIESKDEELLSEKKKIKDAIASYKKLKSQYNFLCRKHGLSTENTVTANGSNEEEDQFNDTQDPGIRNELNKKFLETWGSSSELKNNEEKFVGSSGARPPLPAMARAGAKRPTSHWRETRSRQCQAGYDPHDDFLDTPFENIQERMNENRSEDVRENCRAGSKQQSPACRGEFKYVEPVRKKAQRELLQGVECKQCEKFYDAVLPDEGKDGGGGRRGLRCEQHDGVSRHRYRFAPPLTPEGFWDLGFDSEK